MRLLATLALLLPLSCAWAITGDGAFANFGQASITTCEATTADQPTAECTTIEGASISEQAGDLLGGVIATAMRMMGMSYGVPAGS